MAFANLLLLTLVPVLSLAQPAKRASQSTTTVTVTQPASTVTVINPTCYPSSSTSGYPTGTSTSHPISSSSTALTTTKPTTSSSSTTPISSSTVTQSGCFWVVPGVGRFANKATFTFNGNSLPTGLMASNYLVTDTDDNPNAPYNHNFDPSNAVVSGGFLNLIVPGGQNPGDNDDNAISCGEVVTVENDIKYASVRTNAIFSTESGTCHGNFFYKSDNQEIDIEYLTNSSSLSNPGPHSPPVMQYTNQPVKANTNPTYSPGPAPSNVSQVHEYRTDWVPGKTMFYLDGVLQKTFTSNVPSEAGPWVWNNWANGDPGFTVGPPVGNSVFKIRDITMYFNTSATAGPC